MLREELKHVLRFLGSNDESMSVWCAESEMMNEQLWYTPKYTGIQAVYLVYTSLTYEHVLARYTAGIQRWWAVYTYTGIHPVYRYTQYTSPLWY